MGVTMHPARLCSLFAVFTVLALAPVSIAAPKRDLPKTEGWIEAKTESFTIYSEAGERRTKRIAVQLERFRQALGRMTQGMKIDSDVPTSTFVFKNDTNYAPYKRNEQGDAMNVSGYFLPRPFQNFITMDASAGSEPMRVVYHEYFHAVMSSTFGDLPLWLNEGLAEYFSTFKDRDVTSVVEVGHPIESHLVFLAQRGLIDWDDVFRTTVDSTTYNEGDRQGAFYAQSWLLVHYLNADERRSKQLGAFLTALRGGTDEDEAFRKAFGVDKKTLGARVDAYRKTGSNYVWWDFGEQFGEVAVETRPLEGTEILFRLGELLAQRGQRKAAETHLTAARDAGWPSARLDAVLGAAAVYDDADDAAEPALRRAVEAEDTSAEPYVLLANLILRRFHTSDASTSRSREIPPPVLEAQQLYEKGLERHPHHFDTLVSFARTCLYGGAGPERGIGAIEEAKTLRPLDVDMLQVQAALTARAGGVSRAYTIIERGIEPKDPKVAEEAVRLVTDAAVTHAVDRLDAGDREGAIGALSAAAARVRDDELRRMVENMRDVVSAGGNIALYEQADDPMEEESPARRAIAEYNKAASLASAGRYDEALSMFEGVAEACVEERTCASARETAAELRRLIAHNRFVSRYNEAVAKANKRDVKGAVEILRALEAEEQDPERLESVRQFLKGLGARVTKKPGE